jgi:hypothetical protein
MKRPIALNAGLARRPISRIKKMNRGTVYLPTPTIEFNEVIADDAIKPKKAVKELKEFIKESSAINVSSDTVTQLKTFRASLKDTIEKQTFSFSLLSKNEE